MTEAAFWFTLLSGAGMALKLFAIGLGFGAGFAVAAVLVQHLADKWFDG